MREAHWLGKANRIPLRCNSRELAVVLTSSSAQNIRRLQQLIRWICCLLISSGSALITDDRRKITKMRLRLSALDRSMKHSPGCCCIQERPQGFD